MKVQQWVAEYPCKILWFSFINQTAIRFLTDITSTLIRLTKSFNFESSQSIRADASHMVTKETGALLSLNAVAFYCTYKGTAVCLEGMFKALSFFVTNSTGTVDLKSRKGPYKANKEAIVMDLCSFGRDKQ